MFRPGQDLQPLLQSLSAAGLADDRVEVFTGKQGLDQLDPEGRRHGLWVRFVRTIEDTFYEDSGDFKRAEETLQSGGSVVAVFTLKDEEKKKRAAEILKAHQGQDVVYWGPWIREYL